MFVSFEQNSASHLSLSLSLSLSLPLLVFHSTVSSNNQSIIEKDHDDTDKRRLTLTFETKIITKDQKKRKKKKRAVQNFFYIPTKYRGKLKAIVLNREIQMFKVFSLIYRWGNLRKKLLILKKRKKEQNEKDGKWWNIFQPQGFPWPLPL